MSQSPVRRRGSYAPPTAPVCLCAGVRMADVSTIFDLELGCWTFECPKCGQVVRMAEEPDPPVPAAEPTPHPPGSEGKIAAMAARFRRRTDLFHPADGAAGLPAGLAHVGRRQRPRERLPRGVVWDERLGRFRARATVRGVRLRLGTFATAAAALEALEAALGAAGARAG